MKNLQKKGPLGLSVCVGLFALALLILPAAISVTGHPAPPDGGAPDSIVGPKRCGECHTGEFAAWQMSTHATGFETMHRLEKAKEIAQRLGIRRIKTDASCVKCHYTPIESGDRMKTQWGVSCESCHGPAKDWIDSHDELADLDPKTHAHARTTHLKKLTALGMRHPSDLVALASSCYGCHAIPDERIVNEGGHPAPRGFELLAWSQGEVRHNYLESAGAKNEEASTHRKRQIFLVGRVLDVRFAISTLAAATVEGPFFQQAKTRLAEASTRLEATAAVLPDVLQLGSIVKLAHGAPRILGQAAAQHNVATKIDAELRTLIAAGDGSAWSGLDALLPSPSEYKGKARP